MLILGERQYVTFSLTSICRLSLSVCDVVAHYTETNFLAVFFCTVETRTVSFKISEKNIEGVVGDRTS